MVPTVCVQPELYLSLAFIMIPKSDQCQFNRTQARELVCALFSFFHVYMPGIQLWRISGEEEI